MQLLMIASLTCVPGREHLLPVLQAIAAERIGCMVISFKDLAVKRKIGDGSIGQVYLGKWQETDVAVKVSALACGTVVNSSLCMSLQLLPATMWLKAYLDQLVHSICGARQS